MLEAEMRDWQLNKGATDESMHHAVASLGYSLPKDYEEFLREHNGGEGFVGKDYLILWKVEELEPFNREYEVDKYAPRLLLFGSNGGGEAYGFDTRSAMLPVVRVPFIGMDLKYATPVANSFSELFTWLRTCP